METSNSEHLTSLSPTSCGCVGRDNCHTNDPHDENMRNPQEDVNDDDNDDPLDERGYELDYSDEDDVDMIDDDMEVNTHVES